MRRSRGHCVRCDAVGQLGARCINAACTQSDYAFVPATYYKAHKDKPGAFADPMIGRRLDDLVLVDELGRGGFSRVYLGLQSPLWMEVAVKLVHPMAKNRTDPETLLRRLDVEATALARISHPNVVRLLKYNPEADPPYLAMEHADGRTLRSELADLVKWRQRLDPAAARQVLDQVFNAIEAAHEAGIVHLDLNPSNIMLQSVVGNHRFVRVFDFGLGRLREDDSEEGRAMGTPVYIAPEALSEGAVGAEADLYALGVLAFTLLNWKNPFFGQSRAQMLANKRDPGYDPAGVLVPNTLSGPELSVYRKAMAADPARRFGSVASLRVALDGALPGRRPQD